MNIKRVIVGNLNTNCYILELNDECLIIDPGSEFNLIKESINNNVVGILITHNHFDHVGALKECSSYYNVKVYDKTNLIEGKNKIGLFVFEVLYTPGHTLDSICFEFGNNLFSGDFIFERCIGRCDLGGDFHLMKESIKKILNNQNNYIIYPGHGNSTTLDDERKMLNYYLN